MYSCTGSDHGQHDRSRTRPSPPGRARRGLCRYRQFDHVVDRGADRWFAQRQHVGTRFASRYRVAGRHRLLVIMNWFFHKIYWGGWIRAHNRRRKALLDNARAAEISQGRLWFGLVLLGFTSLYREGFEVVLFLQSYHLRLGGAVVLKGALLGIVLTAMVALDLCSSAAATLSENADHYRHSPRSPVAGNGRRASAGNAAGPLDFHD